MPRICPVSPPEGLLVRVLEFREAFLVVAVNESSLAASFSLRAESPPNDRALKDLALIEDGVWVVPAGRARFFLFDTSGRMLDSTF